MLVQTLLTLKGLGFKVHTRVPVVISNGLGALDMCSKRIQPIARLRTRAQLMSAAGVSACAPDVSRLLSLHAYSYIQQSCRSLKSMNAKDEKSPIHENADANITCDFGDGDISRLGVESVATHTASPPVSL